MKEEKIVIISDIHANVHALKALLKYIEKYDVKVIFNCGDFTQIGPNPKEVFDIITKDKRFINILGNNDLALLDVKKLENSEKLTHIQWTLKELGEERIKKLKKIPLYVKKQLNGYKFLAVHSRMNSTVEYPMLYQSKPLREYTKDYGNECDYVLIGHTHFQSYITHWEGKPIINAGSLGISKDGNINFVIATINDIETSFEFKKVKYDYKKVIEDLNNFSVPDKDNIIEFFFKMQV